MQVTELELLVRCNKLGIACDALPRDAVHSAWATLACFPMYMVANVHAWTDDRQFRVPVLDLPGAEQIREAFVIGEHERDWDLTREHRHLLGTLLPHAKPSDRVIYDFALDTLALALDYVEPHVATKLRDSVRQMVVAVAEAAGKGIAGSGPKVTPQERHCLQRIAAVLRLPTELPADTDIVTPSESPSEPR